MKLVILNVHNKELIEKARDKVEGGCKGFRSTYHGLYSVFSLSYRIRLVLYKGKCYLMTHERYNKFQRRIT